MDSNVYFSSVDSQTIDLGSDDTSNDFSDVDLDNEFQPSGSNLDSTKARGSPEQMDLYKFADLAKKLEERRLKKMASEERLQMSDIADSDIQLVGNPNDMEFEEQWPINRFLEQQMQDVGASASFTAPTAGKRSRKNAPQTTMPEASALEDEPIPSEEEWAIDRWLRLQREQDMENAGTSGRLTAPPAEIRRRKRPQKMASTENNALVDELRTKQLALVTEQLELQQILQETALMKPRSGLR